MTDEPHEHYEDDFYDGECWQCGGEGRVAGTCIDGCCLEQDDPDCPYCSHRCDVCNPRKPNPQPDAAMSEAEGKEND